MSPPPSRPKGPSRLSEFPFVVVRVDCALCHRNGSYRLARLAAKFGAEADLEHVLDQLALDCSWRPPRGNQYVPKCKARFVDLDQPRPPDLPPGMKRLVAIKGGKVA